MSAATEGSAERAWLHARLDDLIALKGSDLFLSADDRRP
jgi:hypothetical protein